MEAREEEKTKGKCYVIMPFSDPEGYEQGHLKRFTITFLSPRSKQLDISLTAAMPAAQATLSTPG